MAYLLYLGSTKLHTVLQHVVPVVPVCVGIIRRLVLGVLARVLAGRGHGERGHRWDLNIILSIIIIMSNVTINKETEKETSVINHQ